MSKKLPVTDPFQPKITRNDRFAQMSHQEKVIEQKKKEIQAKLEAKLKTTPPENPVKATSPAPQATKSSKSPVKKAEVKKTAGFNLFSNDGSFLDTFKQLKEKKPESKWKTNKAFGDRGKNTRWSQQRRSTSPKERKSRVSRFSDKVPANFEQKITINTSFNQNFDSCQQIAQNVTGQPLLKNLLPPPGIVFPASVNPVNQPQTSVIAAPPLLLNVPPPQIVAASSQTTTLILPSNTTNVLVTSPTVLTPVSMPLTSVSLPLTTMNVSLTSVSVPLSSVNVPLTSVNVPLTPVTLPPPPAIVSSAPAAPTLELATIPPPNPIQLQNIPQPEPLNAVNIPHPAPLQVSTIPTPGTIQLNEIPNPKPLDLLTIPTPNEENVTKPTDPVFLKTVPPPNKSVPPPPMVHVVHVPPPNFVLVGARAASIPSLMAQPVLPPPGMTTVNVSCPPPGMLATPPPPPPPPPPANQMAFMSQPPPMNVPPPPPSLINAVFTPGTAAYEAMTSLGRMVAQCGPQVEEEIRQRKSQDPHLWFLYHKESPAYQQYQRLVEQYKSEMAVLGVKQEQHYKPEDLYEPEMACDDEDTKCDTKTELLSPKRDEDGGNKRKRRSRWGEKDMSVAPPTLAMTNKPPGGGIVMLSKLTRTDPGLIQYTVNTYGSANLTEEEWKKAEDNYKINLLYQEMVKRRQELEKLQQSGRQKYDYDSDEDVEGGTWEHKLRDKEMMATQLWAQELTRQAEGKHHIGDFLPPEELKRFLEKSSAVKDGKTPTFSDYKEFKIKEDNIGFQMLQKLGWTQGQGLGSTGSGIVDPVNKAPPREQNQGLGLGQDEVSEEDEYEAYRKRMMLAYRFRPNPLNNPRRPYY